MSLFKETPEQVEEFLFPGFDTGEERELITEFCFQPLAYQEPGMEPTPEMIEAAQGIVGEARKRAQHIERQAYEEGFEQGQNSSGTWCRPWTGKRKSFTTGGRKNCWTWCFLSAARLWSGS
ncbi:MAG: hypothetical protein HY790_03025 [Deltaproteobacteria bacterium]|nr:hypothetical protein [Deltaproteobacteria bacterium]